MTTPISITILYFAQLADEAGIEKEILSNHYDTLEKLYKDLQKKYHFTLSINQLRVALNQEFVSWQTSPQNGDEVAFIPPVAGG